MVEPMKATGPCTSNHSKREPKQPPGEPSFTDAMQAVPPAIACAAVGEDVILNMVRRASEAITSSSMPRVHIEIRERGAPSEAPAKLREEASKQAGST